MSETVFTFPGKIGDAFLQFPVAAQWARQTGKKFKCWLDMHSLKPVENLFQSQTFVTGVEFKPGIENYLCGGCPWHFDLDTKDYEGKTVYHLGFRQFPQRQITLETVENAKLPIQIDIKQMTETPAFDVGDVAKSNRLILHGQPVYVHNRSTPGFWKFLHSIKAELDSLFDEIVFVGNERDREVGKRTYPEWETYDDGGDFLVTAKLIAGSRCCIGVGSSVVALSGVMCIPTIRVHDSIGTYPKVTWSVLGDNQLNDTELELRTSWPGFRDKWLKSFAEVVSE